MAIEIDEILRRSIQGVTQPFFCRDRTGSMYVVKGITGCGREALRAEWLCGQIGRLFDLPIPEFSQATVPPDLIDFSAVAGIVELRGGQAFASLQHPNSQEVTWSLMEAVPIESKARILLFDWLILNNDRILTPQGGNPNLICSGSAETIAVIDHQAAFDREFDVNRFWSGHVCSSARPLWMPHFQAELAPVLAEVEFRFPDFWNELPDCWFEENDRESPESHSEHARIEAILNRPRLHPDSFWNGIL